MNMKKWGLLFVVVLVMMLFAVDAEAQCSICTKTASQLGEKPAKALNGAIIYLNSDFEGGELYYPNLDIVVKPEPGLLAIHPGTLKYLHGVKPVIGNTRYTLTSFFKYDNSTT